MSRLARWALIVVLLGHFALALQFSMRNPLGEAPDEADHWAYAVYLAVERRLPEGPALTQAKHPPLHYVGAALFAALGQPAIDFFHPNPQVNLTPGPDYSPAFFTHEGEGPPWSGAILSFHLARLWSVLISTLTVAATFALAIAAFPQRRAIALASAGVVAFLPEFLFLSGAVTNDISAALWGTAALWGALTIFRDGGVVRRGWWSGLALGFGLLAKVSSLALWPVTALALALGAWNAPAGRWASGLSRWVRACLLVFVPALLIVAWWFLRNQTLYGDFLGMGMARQTIDVRSAPWTWGDTIWLLRGWYFSFWGKFGGAGHIAMPGWFYAGAALVCLAAVAGLVRMAWRGTWRTVRAPLLLLLAAVLSVMVVLWRYSLEALGTDQGRLLYPALGAIVALIAAGLVEWLPERWHEGAAILLAACLAVVSVYGLWGVLLPAVAG